MRENELALEYCVKKTAIQLSKHFNVFINLEACRGLSSKDEQASALADMVRHGITLLYNWD